MANLLLQLAKGKPMDFENFDNKWNRHQDFQPSAQLRQAAAGARVRIIQTMLIKFPLSNFLTSNKISGNFFSPILSFTISPGPMAKVHSIDRKTHTHTHNPSPRELRCKSGRENFLLWFGGVDAFCFTRRGKVL